MNAEQLYQRLPVFLQNAACSAVGWKIRRTRFGAGFVRHLAEAETRAAWSEERLLDDRDERLRAMVAHCAATVPYYQRLFRTEGIDPAKIRRFDDLTQLPLLTKDDIRRDPDAMLSDAVPPNRRTTIHTSGTTGGGLRFATTLDAVQQQWAVWWRYWRWHGIRRDMLCATFGGRSIVPSSCHRPPFWRYNRPMRQIIFSGYHMNAEYLPHYVVALRRQRPPWLHGYPSLLALLAAHLLDTGSDLGYRVEHITIGAENLLPHQIELMYRAFGVRPCQHYGMAEAVANISQCEAGSLHVDEDFAAVEFIPQENASGHQVVGTTLTNFATPMLRYDVQDVVTLTDATCSCGRAGRLVANIDGRLEDYVVLANGVRVGRMDHVFKDLVRIQEAQICQQRAGAITIFVVRGRNYSDNDHRALLRETETRLGKEMQVTIEYVERLERSKTGKLRLVVSTLERGQL